jgi:pimeloyl-ACP methyl ester carboxylesterase
MDVIADSDASLPPLGLGAVCEGASSIFHLGDGRRFAYSEFGAQDGYPVLALHGTPGSRLKFRGAGGVAASLGLRLICPDRWGYGDTSRHPSPSLSRFARDGLALIDSLGIRRFALIGVSGGGPYAAAVAAVAGERVSRLALVSPVGPIDALSGVEMRAFHRLCFRILPRIPGAMTAMFRFYRRLLLVAPRTAIGMASRWSIEVDREIVRTPMIRDGLAASFKAGLLHRAAGAVCDVKLFSRPWDVEPWQVRAQARVWLGELDRNVPQAAALELADSIPGAELTWVAGEGHFLITRRYDDVLRWLAGGRDVAGAADQPANPRPQSPDDDKVHSSAIPVAEGVTSPSSGCSSEPVSWPSVQGRFA